MAAKKKARVRRVASAEELERAVRALVERASGLSATELRRELSPEHKTQAKEALEIADGLAARGEIYRQGSARKVRFFHEDPLVQVGPTALAVLAAEEPLSEADLKKRVEARRRGLGDLVKEWLKGALRRGEAYPHAPLPRARTKRYGREPDPKLVFKRVFVALEKARAEPASKRIPKTKILELIAENLGVRFPGGAAHAAAPEGSAGADRGVANDDRDALLRALSVLAAERAGQGLLLVRELRAMAGLEKERFDAAALDLSRERAVILHHHDFPESLSAAEREELVRGKRGTYYVGIAPGREP